MAPDPNNRHYLDEYVRSDDLDVPGDPERCGIFMRVECFLLKNLFVLMKDRSTNPPKKGPKVPPQKGFNGLTLQTHPKTHSYGAVWIPKTS